MVGVKQLLNCIHPVKIGEFLNTEVKITSFFRAKLDIHQTNHKESMADELTEIRKIENSKTTDPPNLQGTPAYNHPAFWKYLHHVLANLS